MQTKSEPKPKRIDGQPTAKKLIDMYSKLKSERGNFETYWQTLHDYFYIEAQDISRTNMPGNELISTNLWDSTTLESADVLAAGFMNYLTPPTSKWFRLTTRSQGLRDNKAVQAYLEDVAEEVHYTLNRSNFYNQIISSYKSSGVYGTSILLEEEDIEDGAMFYSLPIKQVCLVEDSRGKVAEYFIEFEYTAKQAAEKWGFDKLSEAQQNELGPDKNSTKKFVFLLHIARRSFRDVTKDDRKNLPIAANWIDMEGSRVIDEGGYNEFPAMCHRFDKRPFVPWGYSPAMKALPFSRILNAIAKTNLRAMMKHTDPPIAVPDNAFIMPFNGNPRSVNYYNKNKMESKDIFAFGNFGDVNTGMTSIEYYSQKVKALMFNDVFLAFDNLTKQMNNPEVMERINEKMTMLGPAVGRYIAEMLNPVVIRTIGILARTGKLPPPPDELIEDPSYEIDCISQLAQSQRRSELNSLVTGLGLVGQMAQFDPAVLDKISSDKVVDEAWSIIGAPARVLRDDAEVEDIRVNRGQMAQQAQQMGMLQAGADVVEKGSKVDLNVSKAKQEKTK